MIRQTQENLDQYRAYMVRHLHNLRNRQRAAQRQAHVERRADKKRTTRRDKRKAAKKARRRRKKR